MAKHDWEKWKRLYVTGSDDVSLPYIASIPGAPSLPSLKRHSTTEMWADQRKRFRQQSESVAIQDETSQAAVQHITRIVDTAEMLTRHIKASRLVGQKAIQAMQAVDPAKLKPTEALAWLKFAIESERLTEGLATQRQEISLDQLPQLSDDDLERIRDGKL